MGKRVGLVGILAIALFVYLIWNDPHGAAGSVSHFFNWSADVVSQAWHKLGNFFSDLAK